MQFIEERRSMATTPATKAAYAIVKKNYILIHKPLVRVVDVDFRALVDIDDCRVKKGQIFPCYAGLVAGVGKDYLFKDTTLFEAINLKYIIDDTI